MTVPPVRIAISSSIAFRLSPKSGRFYGYAVENAFQLIDDKSRKSIAFHVLGNDQKSGSLLSQRFDDGKDLLQIGNLFIGDKDIRGCRARLPFYRYW